MKHQPKSGSASRKKPHRQCTKRSRTVPIEPQLFDLIEQQKRAFRTKFGRDPGPGDPIFFDPDCDVPTAFDPEKMSREIVSGMVKAGLPPELIHAHARTGLLVTEFNVHKTSRADLARWQAAIDEYFELQRTDKDTLRQQQGRSHARLDMRTAGRRAAAASDDTAQADKRQPS